jgi:hypothetical protein
MLKVTYLCGLRQFVEYICVEHKGWAGHRAKHWLKYRGLKGEKTAASALEMSWRLTVPNRIRLDKNGKYTNVVDYSF